MSAFITTNETKSAVAALIYAETYHAGNPKGIFFGGKKIEYRRIIEQIYGRRIEVWHDNAEQIIYNLLDDMNAESVATLYKTYKHPVEGKHAEVVQSYFDRIIKPNGANGTLYGVEGFKRLACFIYQAEDIAPESKFAPLLKMLNEMLNGLAKTVIIAMPEFETVCKWC